MYKDHIVVEEETVDHGEAKNYEEYHVNANYAIGALNTLIIEEKLKVVPIRPVL